MSRQLLVKSENHNINYLAKICKVTNVRDHPNADKLNLCNVDGYTVIVGKHVKEGDIGVFFPIECIINDFFLSFCNLYRDKDLNNDPNATPGFFEAKYDQSGYDENIKKLIGGRVKAVKLRGVVSEGFWIEIKQFENYLVKCHFQTIQDITNDNSCQLGTEFDTVISRWLVKKYVPQQSSRTGNDIKQGKKAKVSLIVPDQFRFHISTPQLQRSMFEVDPFNICSITYKIHGTSGVSSNLLVKDTSFKGKVERWLGTGGVKYDNIYSSRRVIKNQWAGMNKGKGYYDSDIWKSANLTLQPFLEKGLTFYYEISGYVGDQFIQKDYDYGCNPGEFNTHIYRITYTNADGKVYEFSGLQVQEFCRQKGINAVPELYYGYIKDLFPINYTDRAWRDQYIELLKSQYVEGKMCDMCKNEVPAEGIVLRIENSLSPKVFKLKNTAFLLKESQQLDRGLLNIEDDGE